MSGPLWRRHCELTKKKKKKKHSTILSTKTVHNKQQQNNIGATIPALAGLPLSACGCKKFAIDAFGDHVSTCTAHSGTKKPHDWVVDQLPHLFHTTHKVKTQQVVRNRGQRCGDIELTGYLANVTGPVPLLMDLHITYNRFGSSSDPSIND